MNDTSLEDKNEFLTASSVDVELPSDPLAAKASESGALKDPYEELFDRMSGEFSELVNKTAVQKTLKDINEGQWENAVKFVVFYYQNGPVSPTRLITYPSGLGFTSFNKQLDVVFSNSEVRLFALSLKPYLEKYAKVSKYGKLWLEGKDWEKPKRE